MPVFLCGPLAWRPLLEQVTGAQGAELRMAEARLPGHQLHSTDSMCFPALVPCPGAQTEGVVLRDAPQDALTRLTFFMRALTAEPRHEGLADGTRALCFVAAPPPSEVEKWNPEAWQDRWAGVAQTASAEIMGHVGRTPPEALHWRLSMILSRAAAQEAARKGVPADLRSAASADRVIVDEVLTPHEGFFLTRDYALRHPQFGGGTSELLHREVFVVSDAALVLPYDPRRDRLLLVEQFRMGPFGRGDPRPWALEPVAGRVDAGESPEDTARRECLEEAGLELRTLERISSHYCSPGCSTEYFHLFLGLCDLPEEGKGQGGLDSEAEDIRTHVISYAQAMRLLDSGEADNGPLVLGLVWLSRERERLRAIA